MPKHRPRRNADYVTMLQMRRQALRTIALDPLKDELLERMPETEADRLMEMFGDRIQTEINLISRQLERRGLS